MAAGKADQLRAHLKQRRAEGLSFIFISHRLRETPDLANRIALMRNGAVVWVGSAGGTSHDRLLDLPGGTACTAKGAIDVGRSLLAVYVVCGLCAAMAGLAIVNADPCLDPVVTASIVFLAVLVNRLRIRFLGGNGRAMIRVEGEAAGPRSTERA